MNGFHENEWVACIGLVLAGDLNGWPGNLGRHWTPAVLVSILQRNRSRRLSVRIYKGIYCMELVHSNMRAVKSQICSSQPADWGQIVTQFPSCCEGLRPFPMCSSKLQGTSKLKTQEDSVLQLESKNEARKWCPSLEAGRQQDVYNHAESTFVF